VKTNIKGKMFKKTILSSKDLRRIELLLTFRIVQENLLYVIGIPMYLADEELLKSPSYFGKYGQVQRLRINHSPKDSYEGQCAVYVWY
jgi:CCR4-NOT transcription complex subunit 4